MSNPGTFAISQKHLHVGLVLKERGWILEKMAQSLISNLGEWGISAELSPTPLPEADFNHWMIYYDIKDRFVTRSTIAITHVDRALKFHVLRRRLEKADLGICMSRMTMEQLALSGIPREKLCFILPGHDEDVRPKRVVIGLTTQIRPDGAKRENLLIEVARSMRLDDFHFSIVGPRWERIIPILQAAGATVDYVPGATNNAEHRGIVLQKLAGFDYYLYMGWDEGSMGLMDALAAGIPTIVTPQGFHVDINYGITHPIWVAADLSGVLEKIADERQQRIRGVSRLTWREYARQHALVWRALAAHDSSQIASALYTGEVYKTPLEEPLRDARRHKLFPYPQKYTAASLVSDIVLCIDFYTGGWLGKSSLYRFFKSIRDRLRSRGNK